MRQARGFDGKGAHALAWHVSIFLALNLAATSLWFEWAFTPVALQASVWATFLAFLLFAARCLQTRRWLALPTVAWGSLAFALVVAVPAAFPRRASGSQASRQSIAGAREAVADWDAKARDVAAWRVGRPPTDAAPYAWRPNTTAYVFGIPFALHPEGELAYDLSRYPGPQPSAAADWRAFGEGLARTVPVRRKEAADYLTAVEAGLAEAPRPLAEQARGWATGVGRLAVALLAYNALALLLGTLVDALPERRRAAR